MPFPGKTLAVLITLALLTGCSGFQFPGVHRIDVQQGNIITQEMIDQLRPGMTKSQVRFIMGTPLVSDSFNPQRWDYYYSLQPGESREKLQERVTIYFNDNDQLSHFSGDFLPAASTRADG